MSHAANSNAHRQRRTIDYRGHVQGVGFRYTTCQVADQFDVVGSVGNQPDGTVRLIVEGEPGELDRFVAAVAEAMEGRIRGVSEQTGEAQGEFDQFRVVHY